jgi:tetratricopeptide (TPR) repeat protein
MAVCLDGDLARAEEAFEKALSIDPNHVRSLVNLSRVLIDQKRVDDALVKLTHAGDIDPDSADVQRLLGRAYTAQGRTDKSVDAYRRAIALDGRDAWSMNNLGLLFLEQQHADEALPLLARAVELRKDVPAFHNNLAMALEHTGRFVAAAAEYRGALTADPGYAKARHCAGYITGPTRHSPGRIGYITGPPRHNPGRIRHNPDPKRPRRGQGVSR